MLNKNKNNLDIISLFFRYDRKNLGCVWDRLHPKPYFYLVFALIVTGSAIIIVNCYFEIYLTFRRSRKRVLFINYFLKHIIE